METLPTILVPTLSTPDGLIRASDNDGKLVPFAQRGAADAVPQPAPSHAPHGFAARLQQRWAAIRRAGTRA